MVMGGLAQLRLAVTTHPKVEVAVQLMPPQRQLSGVAAQAVFGRENIRGMQRRQRQLPASLSGGKLAVRVVLIWPKPVPDHALRRLRQLTAQPDTRGLRH